MEHKIFDDYGCVILKRDGELFICYESGESSGSRLIEKRISIEDAEKAMLSEKDAYELILKLQNKR